MLYTEIHTLKGLLMIHDIYFDFDTALDGYKIVLYYDGAIYCSAVQNCGSYGVESNLLEISGMIESDFPDGTATAMEVYEKIKSFYLPKATTCTLIGSEW